MPERDLWFELPPQRIRELMREATKFYQKGQGKFKSQLIVLLDRETLEKRKALEQSKPKPDYFDEILANYQREHPEEVE